MVDLAPIENAENAEDLARAYATCLAEVDPRSGAAVGEVRRARLARRRALSKSPPRKLPRVHVTPPAPVWTFWYFWLLLAMGIGAVVSSVVSVIRSSTW